MARGKSGMLKGDAGHGVFFHDWLLSHHRTSREMIQVFRLKIEG
jgi:hypothetical protein